jgi:selenide,water dikinase
MPKMTDERLLTGDLSKSDAAVYRLTDDLCGIFTLDVFAPIVDDPETFGRIVFANSISDICAMGGQPMLALNIALFPREIDTPHLAAILKGCALAALEHNVLIVGGHTAKDQEVKYGLSVFGVASQNQLRLSNLAKPGQAIILTKPLGTGILYAAREVIDFEQCVPSMTQVNCRASRILANYDCKCATDVTGFGFAVSLAEILRESRVGADISVSGIPLFPDTFAMASKYTCPVLSDNINDVTDILIIDPTLGPEWINIFGDAQTSGGLLAFIEADKADDCLKKLIKSGVVAGIVGHVTEGETRINVTK